MVVGDQKPFLTCAISLLQDPPMSGNLQKNAAAFLVSKDCSAKTINEAKSHPNFRKVINDGLKKANIELDRKVLSDIAIHDAATFTTLVERAKAALAS